jgi:hypothetical protein
MELLLTSWRATNNVDPDIPLSEPCPFEVSYVTPYVMLADPVIHPNLPTACLSDKRPFALVSVDPTEVVLQAPPEKRARSSSRSSHSRSSSDKGLSTDALQKMFLDFGQAHENRMAEVNRHMDSARHILRISPHKRGPIFSLGI